MPRVHTKKAKFDTYRLGLRIEDPKTKKGYRIDRSKPADEKDTLFCRKGDTYYTWSFRYGGTHRSLTYPKRSQLTQSDFLQRVYGVNETIEAVTEESWDDIEQIKDDLVSELEELRDEQEEKRNNMPEGLQEGPTGEMLQERYDYLDEMISALESFDCDLDEDLKGEEREEEIQRKVEEFQQIQYEGS